MSHIQVSNLKTFLRDVRENPDSFPDLYYPLLVKTIRDIENQSLKGARLDDGLFTTERFKPCYRKGLMLMTKPGFKDGTDPKVLDGVTIDLYDFSSKIKRIQLVICASKARPVHVGIRVQYHSAEGWVLYPSSTNKVSETLKMIIGK